MQTLPQYINDAVEDYIKSQPDITKIHARAMIKKDILNIINTCNPMTAEKIINNKYNFGLDCDRNGYDYGGRPE